MRIASPSALLALAFLSAPLSALAVLLVVAALPCAAARCPRRPVAVLPPAYAVSVLAASDGDAADWPEVACPVCAGCVAGEGVLLLAIGPISFALGRGSAERQARQGGWRPLRKEKRASGAQCPRGYPMCANCNLSLGAICGWSARRHGWSTETTKANLCELSGMDVT